MKTTRKLYYIVVAFSFLLFASPLKAQTQQPAQKQTEVLKPSAVMLDNILTKLKLKGRGALAYLDSGDSGSYGHGTFEVPDLKLVFGFEPDERNSFTVRFNLNNAIANTPLTDFVFLQCKDFIPSLRDTWFSISGRVGRFKLGVGEETFGNNAVEGILPSNSAANIDGSDEGVELSGKFWAASVGNGNRGVGADVGDAKAWMTKVFYSPLKALYLSATYYDSGELKNASSEVSVAGIIAPVANTLHWTRRVWEGDIRYDFKKGEKPLNPPAFSESSAFIRFAYGRFDDDMTLASSTSERNGHFGFGEVMVELCKKIYTGARVSFIDLDGSQTASLNNVTTNHYERYSAGVGYRWSDNVHIKAGFDHNQNGGASTTDTSDDLFSALLAIRL